MRCLLTGILVLSVTTTVALAGDYEIFVPTMTVAPGVNNYSVERFDHKNKQRHHCIMSIDTETKKLTGECIERHGFPQRPAVEGPNVQTAMSVFFGGLPLGYWQIDRTSGKTEFCAMGPPQCVEITPR